MFIICITYFIYIYFKVSNLEIEKKEDEPKEKKEEEPDVVR